MSGPACYQNWRLQVAKADSRGAYETAIYTDAHITGMIDEGYGPYQFLNPVQMYEEFGVATPAIFVRVRHFGEEVVQRLGETRVDAYHGGWLDDELAAVLSLCLGIRARAGDRTREFGVNDPLGLPCSGRWRPNPVLPPTQERIPVIPSAVSTHNLDEIAPFSDFHALSAEAATAVIRSARLFQQGLWIADSDPNLCWILFSSAIEAGANYWHVADDAPVESFSAWKPALASKLAASGGPDLLEDVARELIGVTRATKKFIDFFLEFAPPPPSVRPAAAFQLEWSRQGLKKVFSKIYEYRSGALHGGVPFPLPMSWPSRRIGDILAEKHVGSAGTGIHTWQADDLPLQLHTFEYLVRNALLSWWKSIAR